MTEPSVGRGGSLKQRLRTFEWPTLAVLILCYAGWGLGTTALAEWSLPVAFCVVTLCTALHSSLSHEMLHGHPFRSAVWNAALVFPALTVVIPYLRFRDTHLAHHHDSILTDPYDDPESNYLDPAVWARLPRPVQGLLRVNNTLAGRLLVGPLVGTLAFIVGDLRLIRSGDRAALKGWLWHIPALAVVLWWMWHVAVMPVWLWAISVYAALSILKIRTFLEHRAHTSPQGRTVVIEDRGLLSWIFLNNNLHVVHHMHAAVPWYRLPELYRGNRDRYLKRNADYRYRSYGQIIRQYFWSAKDPVPHPHWPHSARRENP